MYIAQYFRCEQPSSGAEEVILLLRQVINCSTAACARNIMQYTLEKMVAYFDLSHERSSRSVRPLGRFVPPDYRQATASSIVDSLAFTSRRLGLYRTDHSQSCHRRFAFAFCVRYRRNQVIHLRKSIPLSEPSRLHRVRFNFSGLSTLTTQLNITFFIHSRC